MLIFSDMDISIALAACAAGGVVPVYRGIGDDGSQQAVPGIYRFLTFIFFFQAAYYQATHKQEIKIKWLERKRFVMETRKRCPKCGHTEFVVTAHVTQDWLVDERGNFIKAISECDEVTHHPDDEDIWRCDKCGYDAAGAEFNIKEDRK